MCTAENYVDKLKRIGELLNSDEGSPEWDELIMLSNEVEIFENENFKF